VNDPILVGPPSQAELHDRLLATPERRGGPAWKIGFAICGLLTLLLVVSIYRTVSKGIGVWGNNIPAGWALGITNFVWWIGIGHAGTFISAILYLLEQRWRTSINRFAEAMTLFAVMQAALFPVLHLGRPWFAYWLLPYPSVMEVWPQVRSALPWDAAAITTYFTVSLVFWYVGLIPDFASLRDHAPTRRKRLIYGFFALGWRGTTKAWRHYRLGYLLLAGLSTPLVVSVHSIVSSDFAIGLTPGWHSTVFPPFFVAGAIFSGFAMVLTLILPARAAFGMKDVITARHLDNMAKLVLVTGLIVTYGYATEFFTAWYSADEAERYQFFHARPFGPSNGVFWTMIACNVIVPQALWWRRIRRSVPALFVIALLVNVGMWCERFVIIVGSLEREYLPSAWADYSPTWVDVGLFTGTIGFFGLLFMIFLRFVPFIAVAEMKELRAEEHHA
jgi:molybdopterin-containing oxidoreductase family membrane subunit